jgi:Photosynthetic reaction centre cytochrome C subunit
MTKTKIKLFVTALFLAVFWTLLVTNHKTGAQIAETKEKTVEQTHKNIQLLKGMPDSQLFAAMNFIRASLGVNCAYCHVYNGEDKWEFEKDDKPTKITARKHIQMTMDLNKASFGGNTVITCNTCHQGQTKPNAFPVLPQTPPEGGAGGAIPVVTLPPVEQILDKYVEAAGGRAAIEKLKTRHMKGIQVSWDNKVFPLEIYQIAPDKSLTLTTLPRGIGAQGFNGTVGWVKNPRGQRELSGAELDEIKRGAEFYETLRLKDLYPNMKVVGKEKIGGREAFVVESVLNPNRTDRLFFDTQTGLLVRTLKLTQTLIGRIPEQIDFEDYREVDGVKMPFSIKLSFVDPWIGWTRKFTEIKHNVTVDAKLFDMPVVQK